MSQYRESIYTPVNRQENRPVNRPVERPVSRPVSRKRFRKRFLSKKDRMMIKNLVRCLLPLVAVIVATIICTTTVVNSIHARQHRFDSYVVETYTVKSGDTLWDIGKEVKGSNIDVRDWISAVEALNEIDAMIYPGQEIKIYVFSTND